MKHADVTYLVLEVEETVEGRERKIVYNRLVHMFHVPCRRFIFLESRIIVDILKIKLVVSSIVRIPGMSKRWSHFSCRWVAFTTEIEMCLPCVGLGLSESQLRCNLMTLCPCVLCHTPVLRRLLLYTFFYF